MRAERIRRVTLEPERFLPLKGCLNFRDLGGYRAGDGRTVRWRRLFRSDAIHPMTSEDAQYVFNDLSVTTIVDLRNSDEIQRDGLLSTAAPAARYHNAAFLEQHRTVPFDPSEDPSERLAGMYHWILQNSGHLIAGALATLAEADSLPAVFHCTAGKDRSGILAAVIQRIQTGEGQYIDISMTDGSFALNSIHGADFLSGGSEPKFESTILNGGSYYDYYKTKDGRYFSVGSLEPKFFLKLLQVMKKYDDVEIDPENQFGNQKDIKSQLSKIFKKKNYVDWCSIFSKVDACVEPVLTFSESIQHSQLKARKMIVDVPADNGTYKKQIGNPVKFSLSETDYRHIGVQPGTHSKEILLEIGFTEPELKILFNQGIVS